ncbi:DUF4245 domain-containing protein [Kitasatospora sp. MAP5-34]|uniref:DUF4245 domain-containing protein n=1 Tax=Kitasatospora sp. MAP5-34 TaxID=3035102 RepID=UPI002475C9F5|nr:DUF4245 domain-containing protein [Kitasatospora sp. MAP5-34]
MAGKSSTRGRQTVRDMILSMLAVVGVAAGAYVFIPHATGNTVRAVDYSSALASAKRAAPYPVLGPDGLAGDWKATSVQYQKDQKGYAVWHLGFVTPSGQYAAVEQSNAGRDDVLATTVPGAQADGDASVAGKDWKRYQGSHYRGLAVPTGTATTVVTGTASYQELAQLAQALK